MTVLPIKAPDEAPAIQKPAGGLAKFKSKRASTEGVETLVTGLPQHKLSDAKDFVRLHIDEENYWSFELCFVNVPIKGQKNDTLHLIIEDLALTYLPAGRILRWRLALASKPNDAFFLCQVPSQNLDNEWNRSALTGCERAKTRWVQATSQKEKGIDGYLITNAFDPDAFPEPNWPPQTLEELITRSFDGRSIEDETHPALARLRGAKLDI